MEGVAEGVVRGVGYEAGDEVAQAVKGLQHVARVGQRGQLNVVEEVVAGLAQGDALVGCLPVVDVFGVHVCEALGQGVVACHPGADEEDAALVGVVLVVWWWGDFVGWAVAGDVLLRVDLLLAEEEHVARIAGVFWVRGAPATHCGSQGLVATLVG